MKNFTEIFSSKILMLFSCLFLFNIGITEDVSAQCSINNLVSITRNVSGNATFSQLDSTFLAAQFGQNCTSPIDDSLFWRYPIIGGFDTTGIGSANPIFISCENKLFMKDTVSSGTSVIFYAAGGLDSVMNFPATVAKDTVILLINDQSPPDFIPAPDTVLNCLADTAAYSMNLGPTNVRDSCTGVKDTLLLQTSSSSFMGDTCLVITRIWTFTDSAGNSSIPDTQLITIIDTIGPFWDSLGIRAFIAAESIIQNDSVKMTNDSTLIVLLDTSSTAGKMSYHFWIDTTKFKPIAVDSCLGVGTIIGKDSVNLGVIDTLLGFNGICSGDTYTFFFEATDAKGHLTGSGASAGTGYNVGDFVFKLIVKDTTPPKVITKPLVGISSPNLFNQSTMAVDSFLIYVDSGMCSRTVDSAMIRIIVRDSISKDAVTYKWRVDSMGMMVDASPGYMVGPATGTYNKIYNNASRKYYIGDYKITYLFRDTCMNVDSFQLSLNVRTWEPIVPDSDTARINASHAQIQQVIIGQGTPRTRIDTIIAFNEAGMCGINLDSAAMRIVAVDTFEQDTIIYKWKIVTLQGNPISAQTGMDTSSVPMGFRDTLNAAAIFYPVGMHKLTYLFRDTSQKGCFNVDSIMYIIIVQDTMPNKVAYNPTPFGANDTFEVNSSLIGCFRTVEWNEPIDANFSNCTGMTLGTIDIVRKYVSGPDPNIFTGLLPTANENKGKDIEIDAPVGTTVIRYVFTDSIGTSDSVDLTIIVTDDQPPIAKCNSFTVQLSSTTGKVTIDTNMIDNNSSDFCGIVSRSLSFNGLFGQSTAAFTCSDIGIQTVTLVVKDAQGNADSCVATILVEDNTPPIITSCLTDTIFYLDAANCQVVLPSFQSIIGVTEICDTIYSQVPAAGTIYSSGTTFTVTVSIRDSSLNLAQCSFTVMVKDTMPPTLTINDPKTDTLYLNASCSITIPAVSASATDNCTPPNPIVNQNPAASTALNVMHNNMTNVVITATDGSGNVSKDTIKYLVLDTLPPKAICPGNQTISPNPINCQLMLPDYRVGSTDNCGIASAVQIPAPGTMIMKDTMVKIIVEDAAGNKDSCMFMVTVTPLPPVPLVSPLPSDSTQCGEIVLVAPRALVNCMDTIYGVPLSGGTPLGTMPPSYRFTSNTDILITWFYSSPSNGVASQTQNVFFRPDTTNPMVVVANPVIELDSSGCAIITAAALDNGSTDNCTDPMNLLFAVSIDTVKCDSVNRTFPVQLYVMDENGNVDSMTSMVTIRDNRPPDFIDVPRDTIIDCDQPVLPLPMVNVFDNCGVVDTIIIDTLTNRPDTSVSMRPDTLVGFYNYFVTYVWTAIDNQGNAGFASQTITVQDTTPPNIPYPDTIYVSSAPDATTCSASKTFNLQQDIMDNCSDTVFTGIDLNPDPFFFFPPNPIDTDNVTFDVPMGEKLIFIRAGDRTNPNAGKFITIIVDDKTAPRPVCVNAISVTVNPLGYVVLDSSDINMNSTDNCTSPSNLLIKLDRDTFRCEDVGKIFTVVMTVTDEAGNFAGCSSQVTIQDFAGAGSFSCPSDTTIICGTSIKPEDLGSFPTVIDVCGRNTLTFADDTVSAVGNACITIQRTWTARDTLGNPTNCVQMIHILDTIAPVLASNFSDVIVTCIVDAATSDSIKVTDDCATTYKTAAMDTAYCRNDTIFFKRIWRATDGCNMIADTQLIRIFDNVAPAINLPSDTFIYNTAAAIPDSCGVFVTIDFAQYVTDCNSQFGLSVRHSNPANDTSAILSRYYAVGLHSVTITAKDSCGNTSTKVLIIDVKDTSRPSVVCVENLILSLGTGGTGVLSVSNVLSSVSDNCGVIDTSYLSQTLFDCSDLGMKTVTLTVRDASGNEANCTVNVEVINQGNTNIISVAIAKQDESSSGANDGKAWVIVTGGSGNYTYQWDDPSNSTTDTISNLAPRLYSVTVTDPGTGCVLSDTVRVNPASPVNYQVSNVPATPGSIIQVPIIVTNFTNIASLDMSFNIANPTIAEFVQMDIAGGFNLINVDSSDFTYISASRVLFSESISPGVGETKPDGTVIFYLNVRILGTTGMMTMISISGNTSATIETSAIINGNAQIIASSSTAGKITIGNNLAFGGTVKLENGIPLDSVTVNLTGTLMGTTETNPNGEYSFTVNVGQSATVRPFENNNAKNGINVGDLIAIESHILRKDTLDSPYKIIAADANRSKTITISDLVELEAITLGQPSFTDNTSWRFVPTSHIFTDPLNPWTNPIPDSIATINAAADFIGIKVGDVTLGATSVNLTGEETGATSREVFRFGVDDQLLEEGQVIEVSFKANNFIGMMGYQMTLNVNPEWLSLENVSPGALDISMNSFGLRKASEGLIPTLWYQTEPLSIEQNATLFTLSFRVNKGGENLSEVLSVSSDMLSALALPANGDSKNVSLAFNKIKNTVLAGFELFQNKPNPFNTQTTISFSLPEASSTTLRFFDFSGRLVHQIKGGYAKGFNEVDVHKNSLSSSGVLYYEIETSTHTARKKMIVLE